MELYDEKIREKKQKDNKRLRKKILVAIIVLIVLIMVMIGVIFYLIYDPNKVTLNLNGVSNEKLLSILDLEEDENGEIVIYAPIKQLAPYLGYKAYNGESGEASEDVNKCYIINDYEIVEFFKDSKTIYKLSAETNFSDYEKCELKSKVSMNQNDGELYIDSDGIREAFNVLLDYNPQTRTINIYTLDKVVASYTKYMDTKVYEKVDESFNNQKAVLNNLLIVNSLTKQKGVLQIKNGKVSELLEPKYNDIKYIQYDSSFLITSNGKVGIIDSTGKTKVSPTYDTLTLIDKDNNLYLASQNGLYGVIDGEGNVIIHMEYNKIGIDIKSFTDTGIKNGYILINKLVPVMLEQKWGFYNIEGEKVTDLIYDQIGCVSSQSSNSYNLLIIPDYNVAVVGREKKYTLMDVNGKELFNCVIDKMYMKVSNGISSYYMDFNNATHDIVEYLEEKGLKPSSETENKSSTKNNKNEDNDNNTSSNTTKNKNSANETEGNENNTRDNENENQSNE